MLASSGARHDADALGTWDFGLVQGSGFLQGARLGLWAFRFQG